jgi:hypothetical protein
MRDARSGSLNIARMMIQRHGLHAGAVAHEREVVAQLTPDIEGLNLWRSVQNAISELRGTSRKAGPRQPVGQDQDSTPPA